MPSFSSHRTQPRYWLHLLLLGLTLLTTTAMGARLVENFQANRPAFDLERDLAAFAYTHVAGDAGFDLSDYPAVRAWLERVVQLPRFADDLVTYPDNARPGAGRSIYDG